jgi:histidine ammonia-lyase
MSTRGQTRKEPLLLDGHSLTLEDVEEVAQGLLDVKLSDKARQQLESSRSVVERILSEGRVVYGITTGFGKFKDVNIAPKDSSLLQRKLLLSHAAGVGDAFDSQTVRAITLLRANALAKGYSGIRTAVVELLLAMLKERIHPIVPEQGSLGASGDLAPLAHLALVLIGEGRAEVDGHVLSGREALSIRGLEPIELAAKEGLALLNGTQVMAALGTLVVLEAERLAKVADIVGAMSLEAQLGSKKPFAEEIQATRPHPGQIASAGNLRRLLEESTLMESHVGCKMVQDAYSLRCMPQVHGASRAAFNHVRSVLEIEINSATDNPLVFDDYVISGGNFHGQPLAFVMDYACIALAELANISERRTERLVNPALSNGLPPFLTQRGGINSGLMVAQYTAAALVSENKVLSHPASVDSIPTSANQEDHVSMGLISSLKARGILANLRRVLAIELLCAAQGLDLRTAKYVKDPADIDTLDFCHDTRGLEPGIGVRAAHALVRKHVPYMKEDRELHLDFAQAEELIASGALIAEVEAVTGQLA